MKPKYGSLIAAFAPFQRSSLLVCASLCVTSALRADQTWTGAADALWTTTGNWSGAAVPIATDLAIFDATSTSFLATTLGADVAVLGLKVVDPAGAVSVGSANTSPAPTAAVTADSASDTFTYTVAPAAPLVNGNRVTFTVTTLPTGLTAGATYFVINATATTFQISTAAGGAAVNFTANGAGVVVNGVTLLDSATDVFSYASVWGTATPLANGNLVWFNAQTGPTGLVQGQSYYVVNATATTYQIANTVGGTPVDLTSTGASLRAFGNNANQVFLGTGGVDLSGTTQNLTLGAGLAAAVAQTWAVPTGYTLSASGALIGTGEITKAGDGLLVLSNNTSVTSGGLVVAGGTLQAASNTSFSNGGLGSGLITIKGGATVESTFGANNTWLCTNPIDVPATQTGTLKTPNRMQMRGLVTGGGTLILNVTTTVARMDLQNNWVGFSGQAEFTGSGTVRVGIAALGTGQPTFNGGGWANCTVSPGGTVMLQPNTNSGGNTLTIGALKGTTIKGKTPTVRRYTD